MLRTIIVSLWACGVTAVTLYLGIGYFEKYAAAMVHKTHVEMEPTFSEPMIVFVPVVSMSEMTGYLFLNMSVLTDTELLKETTIPIDLLVQDSYLTYLAGNEDFALPNISKFDDQKIKSGIKNQINKIVGDELVLAVYLSDINYLETKELHARSGAGTLQIPEEEDIEAEANR